MPGPPLKPVIVLFQLGGPDSLDAVEPFLRNLFLDPDIIDLPGAFLFRRRLARFISSRRAPKVRELYRRIGGRSPILKQTLFQAKHLERALKERNVDAEIVVAMRYWHPMTDEAVRRVARFAKRPIVFLPLYPHYSKATTGSSINEWKRQAGAAGLDSSSGVVINSYHDHPLYIEGIVEHIRCALNRLSPENRRKVHLVFSAHGTPMKLVRDGDPYSHQIRETYELVVAKGGFGLPHHLCFQSKVGPQKWLEPSLTSTVESLARSGVTHMIVVPIAFVTDHIETLSEINIEAREEAHRLGVKHFDMMPALLGNRRFVSCLADLVLDSLGHAT